MQEKKFHKGRVTKCHVQNKVKFLNRKMAERHADEKNFIARAYYCKECDHFHLTSKELNTGKQLKVSPRKKKKSKRPYRYT